MGRLAIPLGESVPAPTTRRRWAIAAAWLFAAAAAIAQEPATPQAGTRPLAGLTLAQALADLQGRGLKIVFSTEVVRPAMRVATEPRSPDARGALDEILEPHGLAVRLGPRGVLVVVPAADDGTPEDGGGESAPPAGAATPPVVAGVVEEELIVTPSRLSLLREEPRTPMALDRDAILELPHLGDDFFRALSVLPGISGTDVSAEFHVRGGRRDETRVVLDGQELYDSFHLKDYDNALSIVAPATLDEVDLSTGGFSAEHGDRMAGVLDMVTVTPSEGRTTRLGLSVLTAQVGTSGAFDEGRGSWLAEVRRGSADFVGRLIGDEEPRYWDGFAKLRRQLGERQDLRLHALHADDALEIREVDEEDVKEIATDYLSSYVWLTHGALLRDDLLVETALSTTRIDRDRRGVELEEDVQFTVLDQRELAVLALRQGWSWQAGPRHSLRWGFELRDFEARYDYESLRVFDDPIADIRHDPDVEEVLFTGRFDERHDSFYGVDRFRLGDRVTVELGARLDRHTQTDEEIGSPRMNLAWSLGRRSVVRAAWGRFTQSQRPYELQVEDGDTTFQPVERSEHQVLGFEHVFERARPDRELAFRVELYRRTVDNPLPRFENLYEPLNTFPETEPDRVRVAPDESVAEGIEVFVRGRHGRLDWWLDYSRSATADEIEGIRVPRSFDQPDAFNVDLGFPLGGLWTMNLAWRFHTGWPTTPLTVAAEQDDEGEVVFVPVLGPRYSERLADYHRLDLRASRRWRWGTGQATFFVDVQNVYDRENAAGFDYEIDDETGEIEPNPEGWTGILPSLGIALEF